MKYFFELGNFKGLSEAELKRVLEIYGINTDTVKNFSSKILIIDSKDIDNEIVVRVFNRLGGFIRAGEIIDDLDSFLDLDAKEKVVFGISYIGNKDFDIDKIQKLSVQIKNNFKKRSISSRYLLPKKYELNSAQVTTNSILEKGFELCIIENKDQQIYGKTLAIQDIESFAQRDYNKPKIDTKMGMLPPKLARIMCNLSGLKEGTIWDPFCGSGTIPMEASILGYNILASDIDREAVSATKSNIIWLGENGYISDILYEAFQFDITRPDPKILNKLRKTDIDAIIFEPYMGPPQTKILKPEKAEMLLSDVRELLLRFRKVVDNSFKGRVIVMIIPSYKTFKGWKTIGVREIFDKRWNILNKEYTQEDLKWERNNSIISRNIFILEKR
ncbi:MAG: DNA methyltransferase [Candidatus Dojkabacteria bacterium]|nr:DNA methyltransferase [Candidatus Dojkabacteria bacterium]